MTAPVIMSPSIRDAWLRPAADGLGVAVAVSLPWSTSATSILVVIWLLATIPILDPAVFKRALSIPAGGLPIVLVLLAVIGMSWADVPWGDRAAGVIVFLKLAVIPLL